MNKLVASLVRRCHKNALEVNNFISARAKPDSPSLDSKQANCKNSTFIIKSLHLKSASEWRKAKQKTFTRLRQRSFNYKKGKEKQAESSCNLLHYAVEHVVVMHCTIILVMNNGVACVWCCCDSCKVRFTHYTSDKFR